MDSATTERTPPGRMSLSSVANRWATNMNSSLIHWYSTSRGNPYKTAPRGRILAKLQFAMDTYIVFDELPDENWAIAGKLIDSD
jgi:hypothetical protein